MNSNKITNLTTPTAAADAANKSYVDAAEVRATSVGSAAQTTANALVNSTSAGSATASARSLYPGTGNAATIVTNGATRMTVTTAGNVGIGTTEPGVPLDIIQGNEVGASGGVRVSSTTTASILFQGATDSVTKPQLGIGTYDNMAYMWTYKSTTMHFGTNNTERMRIT